MASQCGTLKSLKELTHYIGCIRNIWSSNCHVRQGLCLASCPLSFLFRMERLSMPPMAHGLVPRLEDSSTSSNQRFSSKLGPIPKARSRFSPTPNNSTFQLVDNIYWDLQIIPSRLSKVSDLD
jgi:hypothetical protein